MIIRLNQSQVERYFFLMMLGVGTMFGSIGFLIGAYVMKIKLGG